ncbi:MULTISPECIES: putative quinol monooxygenase [Pseudomonas]|uniref:putative quinol monooxygenase n=1 Tax=Pseudomonas TaxID=286 RepID=UPI001596D7FA|nr:MULTISPECIES: putative quinol monooxygenase [Pseudomonas]
MTSTITVVAHITADPSSVAEVHSALLIAVEATQSEHGCLHYRLFENMDTQGHWTMLELWQNDDALTQHTIGEAFKNLSAAIDGKASVQVYRLAPAASAIQVESVVSPNFWLGNGLP